MAHTHLREAIVIAFFADCFLDRHWRVTANTQQVELQHTPQFLEMLRHL